MLSIGRRMAGIAVLDEQRSNVFFEMLEFIRRQEWDICKSYKYGRSLQPS
jgi:hypothetical protein